MKSANTRPLGLLLLTALGLYGTALWLREPAPTAALPVTPIAPVGATQDRDEPEALESAELMSHVLAGERTATSTLEPAPTSAASPDTPTSDTPVSAAAPDTGSSVGLPSKRAETQRWFAPVARSRSYGELAAALASLPGEASARRELLEPIARWCRTAAQEVYDTDAFQRYAPLRWQAIRELRSFCVDAPDRTPLAGDWIQPLGMTLLMHFARETVGRLDPARGASAGQAALADARQLVDQANALQWMQTQGLLAVDPALGCQLNCGPYYWAAAMLIACQDAGGCGYRSPITLGYCAANFGGGGCRPGADYATALRDRLSQADWMRVQHAVRELQQSLAEPR